MALTAVHELTEKQRSESHELWNNEYPAPLKHQNQSDFESYLRNLQNKNHLVLLDSQRVVKGWYMSFRREDEKWFAMILNREIQGRGYGSKLLNKVLKDETLLSGWVIDHDRDLRTDGTPYRSPLDFYTKHGFQVVPDIRLEQTKISAVKIIWKSK